MNDKTLLNNVLKLLFALAFLMQTTALSQKYFFKKFTEADGLVQGTVRKIYQDSYGRMWFGTVDGLSIYDGSEFSNYKQDESLKIPIISGFLEISKGVMLVATLGDGIEVFFKHPYKQDSILFTIKDKKFLIDPHVNQIKRDREGNIWICTESGITKWLFKNNSFTSVIHESEFNGLGKLNVYSVSFSKNGKIYFGTDKGLLEYEHNTYRIIAKNINKNSKPVFYTYMDRQNTLWFSTLKKIFCLKNDTFSEFTVNEKPLNVGVNSITERDSNEIIIGGLGEIIILKKNGIEIINEKNGFTEQSILSQFIDNEGNIWIGSLEGLSRLSKSNFRFVNLNSVKLNFPHLIKTNNKLYLGNANGMFLIQNFKLERVPRFKEFDSVRILDYLIDGKNEWFATDKGLILRQSNRKIIYDEQNGLPHDFVYSVAKDSTGIIWIQTQGGLAYIKNGSLYNFKTKLEPGWKFSDLESQYVLSNTSIRQTVVDNKNTKWITTWHDGLIRIGNDSIYRFTEKDGLQDLLIRSLFLDSKNNLWIGTRLNGVYKYDGHSFSNISTKNGLKSNWIFSISEDFEGNYWFSTSNGINKFDGKKWLSFGAADGIYGGEVLNSVQVNNTVWFNSWDQTFCYLSGAESDENIKPKVFFREINTLDKTLHLANINISPNNFDLNSLLNFYIVSKPSVIDYTNNTLIFDFAGTTYKGDNQIVYDYMLEGFDKKWIEHTKRNYVTYAHLQPGNYKFVVYAINRDGEKSELPATFSFTILPPFWLRWWFITPAIILFILGISFINYFIYQYKIKQTLKIEKLRSKISTDLHDEIGTSLSSIAIFSELIKRDSSLEPKKISDMLERIENTSRELIDKMSDIVWAVNPGNDKFEDALMKLRDYTVKILESKGIDVSFDINNNEINTAIPMDIRRNMLLIFKELVTNAAKYSKATSIKIIMKFENNDKRKIYLEVADNGIGFDVNKTKNGNGIKNIFRRSEEINAVTKIKSEPGKGTIAVVEIPLL